MATNTLCTSSTPQRIPGSTGVDVSALVPKSFRGFVVVQFASFSGTLAGTGRNPARVANSPIFVVKLATVFLSMKTRYFAPSTIKMPGAVPGPFHRLAVVPSWGCNFSACHAPTVMQSNPPLFGFIARDVRTFSRSPGPVRTTLSLFQYCAHDPLLFLHRSCSRGAPPSSSISSFSVAWLQQPVGAGGRDSSSLPHALIMSAS
mmetsp:Transcript_2734/g.10139  ORF Transcript_2734/g.10139 Transcript_2734/m.10139 type:complete len:203 (-) Transcript_2734:330-938(-)